MRRIASLAGLLALIWIALSSAGAPSAKAGWAGAPGTGPYGGWPDVPSACQSWGSFFGQYAGYRILPNPGSLPYVAQCMYLVNAIWNTNPICPYGYYLDAYMKDGCAPPNAAPLPRELGCGGDMVGNPICVVGGNKFEVVTDFATPTPDKLAFTRYYNSGNPLAQTTMLGNGWRSIFDAYIDTTNGASGPVYYYRADGQIFELDYSSSTGWYPHDTDADLTVTQSGSSWTLTDSDDTVSTFTQLTAKAAMLASVKTRSGYTQTLQYNAGNQLASVTDSYGRTLQFTYQNGLMQTMTVPDGSVYQYLYQAPSSGQGMLLSRVVKPGHSPTSPPQNYLYENTTYPLALTGIVDDNGNRFATFTLEQYGRPTTSQHAGGADATNVTYTDSNDTRVVTNPLGKQETFWFSWNAYLRYSQLTEIDRAASSSTPAASSFYSYDSNGFLSSKKDWNGILTTRTNNARGLPLSVTTASGTPQARTVTYTWDSTYRVPTQIVEPGRTTTFTYSNGLLVTKTETDTTTATVPYSTNGRTRSWTYTYTPTGLVATVKGPRTDVNDTRSYGYDASGTLVSVTNALSQVTQITQHDGSGRPLTAVDANGVTTNLAYTPEGWLNSVTVVAASGNAVTTIAYDAQGEITKITRPDGSYLSYTYDQAHRLTRVADAFDERIDYTLDAMGNRTLEQIHTSGGTTLAKTQSRVFDDLGRLLQSIGAANQTTSYAYDNDSNLTSITDPLSHVTGQSFDALNRLIQVAAPLSSTTAYGYDAHDNRTQVTDPRGLVTSYVYDGLDNLIQVTSPDTGTTVYVVDDAGNRIQETDAAGNVVQTSYDALNRIKTKNYPGDPSENVGYRYDEAAAGAGIGRLAGVADASGSTIYYYDARGNVQQQGNVISGKDYVTRFSYDLADHVVRIIYPSGQAVTYTRDGMGRITGVTTQPNFTVTPVTVASGATYAPFGPLTGLTYGNGLNLRACEPLRFRGVGWVKA